MTTYKCNDGDYNSQDIEIEAASPREAAEDYVAGGCWGDESDEPSTFWVDVHVWEEDEDGEETEDHGWRTVTVDPPEPECIDEYGHDWRAPHVLVGGLRENPGVWGHGGGVIVHEVCVLCGAGRETDTWAQRRDTGEQGLTSITYHLPGFYDLAVLEEEEEEEA